MLTHDNMLRNAWAVGERMGIHSDDRYFNCRPFFHVAGTTLSLLVSLIAGACLVTLPTFEAGAALAMMAAERCTLTSGNDTLFQLMMGHPTFDPTKLHLRGGWSAAGPETVRNIIEKMGARAVCIAYGLSEASPNVVLNDYRDDIELRIAGLAKPLPGVEVRITVRGAAQPPGETGEIEVRGWNVMRGYYKNPEETAKTFTTDGWLRTGDLGVLTGDGRLRMVGRLKDVFRVGGENVAPAEVEEVLLAHPAVATAQVVGVPDARLGEVGAAFVTLKGDAAATETEIAEFMKHRCANFRVPRYVAIVESFEAIGMTASGKVQKNRLREHAIGRFGLDAQPAAAGVDAMTDVVLCECFARDGLQHELDFVPTERKRALIERFADLGFQRVEATSYSNPKVVPQFADASDLLRSLPRRAGVHYKATCANVRAVERALVDLDAGFGVTEISLLVSASEAHSMKNLRQPRAAQWDNIRKMATAAQGRFRLIGTISVAFGCPFEGAVDPAIVVADAIRFAETGVTHVALGDTTGMATPASMKALVGQITQDVPSVTLIAHLHDTRGTGLVNAIAAYEAGVRYFDCSFGGVGGHPAQVKYGGGYTGNVCTEDLVNLFESLGIRTGIDLSGLIETSRFCEETLGRELHGRVTRSGLNPLLQPAS